MGNTRRGNKLTTPTGAILVHQDTVTARIPPWVVNHASFRKWAASDEFPQKGQFAFLSGNIWVDLSMERLVHNLIKGEIARVLATMAKESQSGQMLGDRMLLTNIKAGLSTEPDGMFLSRQSVKSGRVRLERGQDSIEVEGSPDMVLEVVSPTSRQKDTVVLRDLYWKAGVKEYWLAEPGRDDVTFRILRSGVRGYTTVREQPDGWVKSTLFGKAFRLTRGTSPDGQPEYLLAVK